jgi:8-oxo-dGTP diphosphatase
MSTPEKPMLSKQFVAVRAVICKGDEVLIIREAAKYQGGVNHGKYDFPGGKVKLGETVEETLVREIKEEVDIEVKIGKPFFVDEWRPVIKGEQAQIIGIFFLCDYLGQEIKLSLDHDDYKWIKMTDYLNFPLIEANKKALEVMNLSN